MREVLGEGIGIGFVHVGVSVTLAPEGKSIIGLGVACLDVKAYSVTSDKVKETAVVLGGADIDQLIVLLREAKRKLLEARAP